MKGSKPSERFCSVGPSVWADSLSLANSCRTLICEDHKKSSGVHESSLAISRFGGPNMRSGISIRGTRIVHRDADGTVHRHGDLRLVTGAGAACKSLQWQGCRVRIASLLHLDFNSGSDLHLN